ncbi:MAG: hypothetical protein IK095_08860 [Oscillospiraceae bacterium]|nr:hypothetical protein [Oscillospiraceae bacterium]
MMLKRTIALLLALLTLAALCACGKTAPGQASDDTPAVEPAPAAATAPADAFAAEPAGETPADEPDPGAYLPDAGLHAAADPAAEAAEPTADPALAQRIEKARSFLDRDVTELIAALGEPLERNYASSCLGSGEDGELRYEGFTVYTYREGGKETVREVIGG